MEKVTLVPKKLKKEEIPVSAYNRAQRRELVKQLSKKAAKRK